jgi:hypothetical protein
MIFDSHMHVGSFEAMFGVSLDREVVESIPGLYALARGNPRVPGNEVVYINGSIDVALRNPNVYLETSGMPMHTKIREAYERVGETCVLFGTDVPFHHPVVEIAQVRVSGLPPEGIDRVLSKNGRLLFFGDEDATEPVAA